jgi:hypothetical protein
MLSYIPTAVAFACVIAQLSVPFEVVSSRLVTTKDVGAGGSVVVVVLVVDVVVAGLVVVGAIVGAVSLFGSTPPNVTHDPPA